MKQLQFETGVNEYVVNDKCTLHFNPADPNFVERLFKVMEKLGNMQQNEEPEDMDGETLFDKIKEKDKEMRETINSVFPLDDNVCDKLFPGVGVYALAGGLPLWSNFLLSILDEIDSSVSEQQKKANPRVEYYMNKYQKYMKK